MIDGYSLLVIVSCFMAAMVVLFIADAIVHYRRGRDIDEWIMGGQEQEGEA